LAGITCLLFVSSLSDETIAAYSLAVKKGLGRMRQPEEAAFLAQDDTSVVTASVWPVKG